MTASIYDIPVRKITGDEASLAEFKGKVLLVVNVASKCGLTPQYEGLEKLYEQYKGQGLVVAGFPANNFKSQEPGTDEEIQTFCTANFGVKFPMFSKITVVGPDKHPLYAHLDCGPAQSDQPQRSSVCQEAERLWNRDQCGARDSLEFREVSRQPLGQSRKAFLARHSSGCARTRGGDRIRNCQELEQFRNTPGLNTPGPFDIRERWLFLRKKPLDRVLSVYANSETAIAGRIRSAVLWSDRRV